MPAKAITLPAQLDAARNAEDMGRRAGWAADGLRLYGQSMDARIGEAITAAEAEMTIEGASTITLAAHDPSRSLLKANRFANQKFDVRIDDEWFRLVGVSKQGDQLSLTFEDRAVAWMRQYSTPRKAYRDQVTRAEFILSLVDEVSEGTILVYCPELHKIQPIASGSGSGGGGGGSPDLAGRTPTLTGKASTYGDTSWYDDPGDDSFGSQKPASGMSPNVPGIATLNSSRTGGWWVWKAPNGRVAALPQSDVGPASGTGCVVDINTPACARFGYRHGNAFPTKEGTWTGWYFGKGESAKQSAKAAAGETSAHSPSAARATAAAADTARQPGLAPAPSGITVKGAAADAAQLRNIAAILTEGLRQSAVRRVLIASIMTATQESSIRVLTNAQSDGASSGIFQQTPGWGTAAQRMDPTASARMFFHAAIKEWSANRAIGLGALCQAVQKSAYPGAYDQWKDEAARTVDAFTASGSLPAGATTASTTTTVTERYAFQRGQGSTRENTWDCAGRLCEEVGWRRWMAGGTLFLIAEEDIFASRPRMRITETSDGVDAIDFDIVMGRKPIRDIARNASVAEMTATARLDAWKAPPGSVVVVDGMGPADGRWLVTSIRWDLFGLAPATITLKKPIRELPEPAPETSTATTPDTAGGGAGAASGDAASLVEWARTQVGYREGPGNQNKYGPSDSWCGYFVQYGLEKIAKLPISSSMGYVPHIEKMIAAGAAPFAGPVSASQMQPGDVISWRTHTGFYIGGGRAISGNYGGGSTLVSEHSSTEPGAISKVGRPRWKS